MSQNRAPVVVIACILAVAGCNPAQTSAETPSPPAPVVAAPSPIAPAAVPDIPPSAAVAPASPAEATPVSVSKADSQAAPTTPARPAAAPREPAPPPPVVIAGLPAGPGREVVQRVCGSCHGIDTVTAVGRTPAQWADVIGQMQNMGLSASDEDLTVIHAYLSRQLPPK